MKPVKQILVVLLLAMGASHHVSAEDWWKINGEPRNGDFIGGQVVGKNAPVSEEIKQFLQLKTFDEWTTYEDDLVRLRYPKHDLLTFETKDPGEQIRVRGGVVTTVDNQFQRAYYLTAGEAIYAVFLLQADDWLDDGACFCGPMVHHVYNIENDCLVRFSLLPGGAVKKAQVLGDKLRLMAFEWTHLYCPRTVYETMVESMELKRPLEMTHDQIVSEVKGHYGFCGRTGLMQKGMSVAKAIDLMGEPFKQSRTQLAWHGRRDDYRVQAIVGIREGKVDQLVNESVFRISDDPIEGTLSWAQVQVPDPNEFLGEVLDQDGVPQISDDIKKAVVDICLAEMGGNRDWEAHSLLQLLAEEYDFYSIQVAEFLQYGERRFGSLEFSTFNLYHQKKMLTDGMAKEYLRRLLRHLAAIDPYSVKVAGDSWGSTVDDFHRVFLRAYKYERKLDPEAARITLARFSHAEQFGYRVPILKELLSEFSQDRQFSLVLSSIEGGSQTEDFDLIEAAFSAVAAKSWSDPAEKKQLREAIETIDNFPNTRRWQERRSRALQAVD